MQKFRSHYLHLWLLMVILAACMKISLVSAKNEMTDFEILLIRD